MSVTALYRASRTNDQQEIVIAREREREWQKMNAFLHAASVLTSEANLFYSKQTNLYSLFIDVNVNRSTILIVQSLKLCTNDSVNILSSRK